MRKHCFVWFLTVLCTVCLAVVVNWQDGDAAPRQNLQHRIEASVMSTQRHHYEATLTDATQLYRVCSSRPQRILPTHGSRSGRTLTPSLSVVRQHHVKPLRSHYDSRRRLETAPFCLSASCDYYVIALRHIIR